MKSKIGDLLIQIVTVMIGVFLGFIVSDWSETTKEQTKADQFIYNLKAEIQTNKNKIAQGVD